MHLTLRLLKIICLIYILCTSLTKAPECGVLDIEREDYPKTTVFYTTGEIIPDGNLSEPAWRSAQEIGPFINNGRQGNLDCPVQFTWGKLLWDDNFLYVAWKAYDINIQASQLEQNTNPCLDDCVEIFITPDPEKHPMTWFNFEINCLGTYATGVKHKDFENPPRPEGRYKPLGLMIGRSHVGTINNPEDTDTYWIIEAAIPWSIFEGYNETLPPKEGNTWRMNLYRCGYNVREPVSQWAPLLTQHRPESHGYMTFSREKP